MRPKELDTRMRELEYFRPLRLLPGAWAILRVDGRAFRRFTAGRFEKPFDERFRDLMTAAAEGRPGAADEGGVRGAAAADHG